MDRDVIGRYEREALPLLERFAPDLLMISAGFDAHERDPLAGCRMTSNGFRALTAMLIDAADRLCDGRAVLVTEGGYDLQALDECLQAVVDVCR
jgi:acetoin utilization deacetylase AcuC-like enzyme